MYIEPPSFIGKDDLNWRIVNIATNRMDQTFGEDFMNDYFERDKGRYLALRNTFVNGVIDEFRSDSPMVDKTRGKGSSVGWALGALGVGMVAAICFGVKCDKDNEAKAEKAKKTEEKEQLFFDLTTGLVGILFKQLRDIAKNEKAGTLTYSQSLELLDEIAQKGNDETTVKGLLMSNVNLDLFKLLLMQKMKKSEFFVDASS